VRAFVVALALVASACSGGCGKASSGGGPTPDPVPPVAPGPARSDASDVRPAVAFYPDGMPSARARVSLARSEDERRRGLMYVRDLPSDDGMLFLFEAESEQAFWMKNTLIPLDMIFIRDDLTVAGVVANAEPLTLKTRSVGVPSRYVLEVNGGWANQHGVVAGTPAKFYNVPR
jgi:uncharacterized membrane protein (UPF0127 family)